MDDYVDWLASVGIRTFPERECHAWIPLRLTVYPDGRGALAVSNCYAWPVATPAEAATVFLDLWTRGRQAAAEARKRRMA